MRQLNTRSGSASTLIVTLGMLVCVSPSQAQNDLPPVPELPRLLVPPVKQPWEFVRLITLTDSEQMSKRLDAAREHMHAREWVEAARLLQSVIDSPEDYWVFAQPWGKQQEARVWMSARGRAEQLLGSFPPDAREKYQTLVDEAASGLLEEAKRKQSIELLREAGRRYGYTQPGRKALELLGTYHVDRGEYVEGHSAFRRLLQLTDPQGACPTVLLKAALASRRLSKLEDAERVWGILAGRHRAGIQLGNKLTPLSELHALVHRPETAKASSQEWLQFRGSPSRLTRTTGAGNKLELLWEQECVEEPFARHWLARAAAELQTRNEAQLSPFFPLADGRCVNYRTHHGVVSADRSTGKVLWESRLPFGGLDALAGSENYPHTAGWVGSYLAKQPLAILGNANAGILSADERHLYVVEDLAIPPHQSTYGKYAFLGHEGDLGRLRLHFADRLTDFLHHNRLWALDRRTGKIAWLVGGRREPGRLALPLDDAYFLGPPLVLGGKLWVLIEKDQQLQLVSLDPGEGTILSRQPLAVLKERLLQDGRRRLWATHPASDGDVLICPTNVGVIMAVDVHTSNFLWVQEYVPPPPPPPEVEFDPFGRGWRGRRPRIPLPDIELDTTWHASAPLLASGRVLINAPDEPALHCLDAGTGKVLWEAKREPGDLHVGGVFGRQVLIVGKAQCRALDLRNGQVMWVCDTGLPSGVGFCSDRTFYLPVEKSEENANPRLSALDLDRGVITREVMSPQGVPLGNVLIHDGLLISQTATKIQVFRSNR